MDTQTRHALKQDSFVAATTSSVDWLSVHRSSVIKTAVLVVVVVAAIIAGTMVYNAREAKAEVAFGQAMTIYTTPLLQPGQPTDPGQPSYKTAAERAKAANPVFEQVANQYGWFKAGANARYFAGLTYQDQGQTANAESELKKAADSSDSSLAALAKVALANLYNQTGRQSQAVDLLKEVIKKPTTTVPASAAKLQLAQLYETTNAAEAKRLYAEIKDQDKTSAAAQIAAQKLQSQK